MDGVEKLDIRKAEAGVVVAVKVVPGASREKVAGALGDALKITTAAPPEKGRANAAVRRTLAKALGVDARSVRLVAGETRARKQFLIEAVTADEVRAALRGRP